MNRESGHDPKSCKPMYASHIRRRIYASLIQRCVLINASCSSSVTTQVVDPCPIKVPYLCRLCNVTSEIPKVITEETNGEYTYKSGPKNFADAKQDCNENGDQLVTIGNLLENIAVNVVSLDFKR